MILKKAFPFVYISKIYAMLVNIPKSLTITVTKNVHV